jgi:hypothetical protein
MKYVDYRTNSTVKFGTLSKGEMFLSNGEPFLKIDPVENTRRIFNAVDLIDGDPWAFDDEDTVEKAWHAELVLKD